MITHKYGDLFTTEARIIGQGVNVFGVMGGGISKQFRSRYPDMYNAYRQTCISNALKPGGIIPWFEDDIAIMNMASQDMPGPNASYDWLESSMRKSLALISNLPENEYGRTFAIPEIGCGIGGLEWNMVEGVIDNLNRIYSNVDIEVWHFKPL